MEYVVANREQNLSSDSYFYATFWDTETKTYEERATGSTAGYGGGWYEVNAPEEVLKEYYAVKQHEHRISEIHFKLKKRKECMEAGHKVGIIYHRIKELFAVYDARKAWKIIDLLKSDTKGKFKLSLKEQVIGWLNTPYEERKYGVPLTDRQLKWL